MNETIHPQPPESARKWAAPRSIYLSGAAAPEPSIQSLVERAFGPDAPSIQVAPSTREFAKLSPRLPALLLQIDPSEAEATAAREACGDDGLPLWAVVTIACEPDASSAVATIGADELDTAAAAALLRLALLQRQTQRDHEQARGDLGSIASRARHDMRSHLGVLQTSTYLLGQPEMQGQDYQLDILQSCQDALRKQGLLIDVVAACAETSAPEHGSETIKMDAAFYAARQRCAHQIDSSQSRLVEASEPLPDAQGVKPWVELMWTLLLSSALSRGEAGSACQVGGRGLPDGGVEYFARFEAREGEDTSAMTGFVPFHRLRLERINRELTLPAVARLAEAQGGSAGARQLAGQGVEYYFSLPT